MDRKDRDTKKSPLNILAMSGTYRDRAMQGIRFFTVALIIGLALAMAACPRSISWAAASKFSIEYGKNFSIKPLAPGITEVHVANPWKGASKAFCYLLKDHSVDIPMDIQSRTRKCVVVDVPVKHIIVLSSTYYAMIDALGATGAVSGASRPQRANTPSFVSGYKNGHIKDVGDGLNIHIEGVLEIRPEVVFTYATGGFRDIHPKLEEAGLKVVLLAEYMEDHPLGRAEWIKFFGLFLGRYQRAETIFNAIKERYLKLQKVASKAIERPTVIMNTPFAGHWFIPGNKSFMAKFLRDAGANYVFHDINGPGSTPVDLELAYQRGKDADYWVNTGTWNRLNQIAHADPRLMAFKAVKTGQVFNNNRRMNSLGGNDYWESGALRADLILADLIAIFHPDLLPDHRLYYYKRLHLNPAWQKGTKLFFKLNINQLLDKNHGFSLYCCSESKSIGFVPFRRPSRLAILPNLLCCSGLESWANLPIAGFRLQ